VVVRLTQIQRIGALIVFLAAPVLAAGQEWVSSRGAYRDALGTSLNNYMLGIENEGFSGALLVERNGEIVIASGYGWSHRESQRMFTRDTVFDIGSITKQFTAAGIMKLQEAGKLDAQDALGKFLPNVPPDKRSITLHHLLTHSSGMRDIFGADYSVISRDDFLALALASELRSEPGTRYRYSNAGYSVLGAVIEIVSGEPYEQFLFKQLFEPSGMLATGYKIPARDRENIVHLYEDGKDWGTMLDHAWLPDGPGWHLRCNGGILSTLEDLRKWHHALLDNSVLTGASAELMFGNHVREMPDREVYYGYGWSVLDTPRGTRLITHNGGNGLFTTDFRRYMDENTLVLMTSSVAERNLEKYEKKMLEIVFPPAK